LIASDFGAASNVLETGGTPSWDLRTLIMQLYPSSP
jgi:hypothetical protein